MSGHRCNYRPAKYVAYTCVYLNNSQFCIQFTTLSLFINETITYESNFTRSAFFFFFFARPNVSSFSSNHFGRRRDVVVLSPVSYDHHRIEALALFLLLLLLLFFFFSIVFESFFIIRSSIFLLPSVTRTRIIAFILFPFHLRSSSSVFFQLLRSLSLFTETITVKSFFPPSILFHSSSNRRSFQVSNRFVSFRILARSPHQRGMKNLSRYRSGNYRIVTPPTVTYGLLILMNGLS